jgi:Excreted virulence factor EspC, type VII ESX diderm
VASETEGSHVTAAELRAAAAKLRELANEMEKAGHAIGGAAAGAAAAMPGFAVVGASIATCGHLHSCVGDAVRKLREQADHLDETADRYTEHDRLASRQVTVP